ncbi:hypothetical protein [Brevifollis gellanilyticus]|uniref:Type II secretion system protein GspG C-terminal domain-containing protein n=1 Tax=Brevifollis gellanilyticus TaxID=748831 RepID=A0A512M1W5_9BACT|nr:hypothetical protein [Brevifollis gellanilyticus]GEP40722.1 hypothetical protein BGE01nite_00130 [Brevifollis gellanilyticus]
MKPRILAIAIVLVVAAAFIITWMMTAPSDDLNFGPLPQKQVKSTAPTSPSSGGAPVFSVPKTDPRTIDPEIQKLADRLVEQTQTPLNDLETVGEFVDLYRKSFSSLPVGSNEDFTAIITGQNPKKGVLFPPDSPMIVKGQLVDRWGSPYWLHPSSGSSLEVRSAGPDKNLFTPDDVVVNPSPGGLGVTPLEGQ